MAQRRAVILDERRSLVVAGAGTGKTSVLVAKVGYLLKSGKCRPEEILMLAFNTKAADELKDRVARKFDAEITAQTFHGLGNQILGHVMGEKPPLHPLASDPHGLKKWISELVDRLIESSDVRADIITFLSEHLNPERPIDSFKTEREYRAYLQALGLRTLAGERVKSLGELDIANFLFSMGVRYAYEPRYEGEVPPNPDRRAYLPDFYIEEPGIYLEHFGLSSRGKPPPFVDQERYLDDMEWKRDLHKRNDTQLLETYSYERSNGTLLRRLDRELREAEVPYEPRSADELEQAVAHGEYKNVLGSLLSVFLTHYRTQETSVKALRKRAKRMPNKKRALCFLRIFERVAESYDALLRERNEIDFSDMIARSSSAVAERDWISPYRYVLVDEFQDLSADRYRLLKSIVDQRGDCKLFSVGDDWQAIYRFAGSDINLMTKFRKYFGRCTITKLDRTFRFNSAIESVSSSFVQRNPLQIRKRLKSTSDASEPRVTLHWNWGTRREEITEVVSRIVTSREVPDGSLLILARYKHDLPDRKQLAELARLWQPGKITGCRTVHAAKGLQADYVLLSDLFSGQFGFPSEIVDDPLLELVMAAPEDFPNAEERRLLYVALTRARHETHLITAETEPSAFAEELADESYRVAQTRPHPAVSCPNCEVGLLRQRSTGRHGCMNLKGCGYTAPQCPVCSSGYLKFERRDKAGKFRCSVESCLGTAIVCDECGKGALVPRTGPYGDFLGCSEYPECRRTKPLVRRQRK